ncbi:MAG TPA: hypothetical protein VNT26_21700, partial [Candidatus Sulfotelmatobacter sp.]|nr:hypothetical protein [Candidatus Sulfotelmatobacter sp.]
DKHAEDLRKLKRLGVLLALEGRAVMLEGRTNETWQSSLDLIRLGQALSRGGLLIDGITGMTLETVGTASLQAMMPQMAAADCRKAVQTLEELEARRSSSDQISQNEKIWSARRFGLVDRLGALTMRQSMLKRHSEFQQRYEEICRRTRRLELRLAARACELETGKRPGSATELVPALLKALPIDPSTGKPMEEIPPVPALSGTSRQTAATPPPISAP